jgi:hypothetical protein
MLKYVVSETNHEQMDGWIWFSLYVSILYKELITVQLSFKNLGLVQAPDCAFPSRVGAMWIMLQII